MGLETGVTARSATRNFFAPVCWALTLAPRGSGRMDRTPLTNAFPIAAALIPTAGLTLLRGPIPLPGTPVSPTPGRLPAGFAAIPGLRMVRLERLLAPLQQAQPTPRTTPALNTRTSPAMLRRAQGRCQLPKGQVAVRNAYSAPRRFLPDRSAPCTPTPAGNHVNRDHAVAPWLPWLRETGPLLRRHRHIVR